MWLTDPEFFIIKPLRLLHRELVCGFISFCLLRARVYVGDRVVFAETFAVCVAVRAAPRRRCGEN